MQSVMQYMTCSHFLTWLILCFPIQGHAGLPGPVGQPGTEGGTVSIFSNIQCLNYVASYLFCRVHLVHKVMKGLLVHREQE